MGNYLTTILQRQPESGVEMLEPSTYRYPPKSGKYFSSHYFMGGERFKTMNEECFLFGDNSDLNYLTNKPTTFPYGPPADEQPSCALRSLVHLRKDSLKFHKVLRKNDDIGYSLEFTFDADATCAIRIFFFATEDLSNGIAKYKSTKEDCVSEPVIYEKGSDQSFTYDLQLSPDVLSDFETEYSPGDQVIPIVIQITVEEPDFVGQSESTFATLDTLSDGSHYVKFLKQKIVIAGFCYILQEIYGIENKKGSSQSDEDFYDDDNTECVICMTNLRDTLILPCRHLCLCNECGEKMKTEQSKCPMCRAPFYALLQVKAMRRKVVSDTGAVELKTDGTQHRSDSDELEEVPLIEALNGYLPLEGITPDSLRNSRRSMNRSRHSLKNSRTSLRKSGKVRKEKEKVVAEVTKSSDSSFTTDEGTLEDDACCYNATAPPMEVVHGNEPPLEAVVEAALVDADKEIVEKLSESHTRVSTKALVTTPRQPDLEPAHGSLSWEPQLGPSNPSSSFNGLPSNSSLERSQSMDFKNLSASYSGGDGPLKKVRAKTAVKRQSASIELGSARYDSVLHLRTPRVDEIEANTNDIELNYLRGFRKGSQTSPTAPSSLGTASGHMDSGVCLASKSDVTIEVLSNTQVENSVVRESLSTSRSGSDGSAASIVVDACSPTIQPDESVHIDSSLPGTPLETSSISTASTGVISPT